MAKGALSISCGPFVAGTRQDDRVDAEYDLGRDAAAAPHDAKDA